MLRKGFRLYWRAISKRGPGRPPIPEEVKALIRRLADENDWRARKIHAELEKLGFIVGLTTVSRYLPKRAPDPGKQQRWVTFLRNHRDGITAKQAYPRRDGLLRHPDCRISSLVCLVHH